MTDPMTSPIGGALVFGTVPAGDMERAKAWYRDKLGLSPILDEPTGAWYEVADGRFIVYPTSYAGTAQSTAVGFHVDDLEEVVAELRGRGVEFEDYDLPGLTTDGGIAPVGDYLAAWCRDSEGNIIMIAQPPGIP